MKCTVRHAESSSPLTKWSAALLAAGLCLIPAMVGAAETGEPARILPGRQADGSVRLHNQTVIRPAGVEVGLGDFPVNVDVDPSGRYAAVLEAGAGPHQVQIVDIGTHKILSHAAIPEAFGGIAFSPDGRSVACSGASSEQVYYFPFDEGLLGGPRALRVGADTDRGVVSGVAFDPARPLLAVARLFDNDVTCLDVRTGAVVWRARLGPPTPTSWKAAKEQVSPNDIGRAPGLARGDEPYRLVWDAGRGRIYASLWGRSEVAVIDARDGRVVARWACGLHPNELALSRDGRLFVSNGGLNTVSVLSTVDGRCLETLSSSFDSSDLPGATPDSLALSPDGWRLYVANAYNDDVAVFDVTKSGSSRPLGFIPAGWFPSCVRITPNGGHLLVLNARGVEARANGGSGPVHFPAIKTLYPGSLEIVNIPAGDDFARTLAAWTETVRLGRPEPVVTREKGNPVPADVGGSSPIKYVIYVIKENRTYDQVFGDIREGNGDPALCLFPERVTPNQHALARQFVLLDNFYANAEVSPSGHEWSMGAYASEFVEKTWPVEYGHWTTKIPYPAEGNFAAAVPGTGYLWNSAEKAGVSYRSYGEFAVLSGNPKPPFVSNIPALKGHMDPLYHPWDVRYRDVDRAAQFISELHGFEKTGDMPRLQVLRLPQDHTAGAAAGDWTPTAMVADNDLAVGQLVEAVSRSRFWPQTAIFIVEDDAQNGPDHVDAHRTTALVISPYTRRAAVDSTPYTTCSMLRTMELILGLPPMTQFDAAATPMWASFTSKPDVRPFEAQPETVDMNARNPKGTADARLSATFDFSHEDAVDDVTLNRVVWASVRGPKSVMPAPRHAAFVREITTGQGDGDDE